jgi:hypothetical protein
MKLINIEVNMEYYYMNIKSHNAGIPDVSKAGIGGAGQGYACYLYPEVQCTPTYLLTHLFGGWLF